jgi:hypothetical protein
MSAERKADLEAALAELAYEIDLAVRQGLPELFQWETTMKGPDGQTWTAILTIGKVEP